MNSTKICIGIQMIYFEDQKITIRQELSMCISLSERKPVIDRSYVRNILQLFENVL